MRRVSVLAIAVTTLCGCVAPKLTRHYDSIDASSVRNAPLSLSAFVVSPKADDDVPFISGLSERGQAELIRSVSAAMPAGSGADALLNALGKPLAAPLDPCAWADHTSLRRRVSITLLGSLGLPANRIDRLELRFSLPQDGRYAFASWDKFDSVYGTYDLGSAKYTQLAKVGWGDSHSATSNLPDGAGGIARLLSANAEASRGLEENMNYAIRRLNVGGALAPQAASLILEGGPYINLLGSSSAVLTLKLAAGDDPMPVHAITFKDGKATLPADVGIVRCQARFSASAAPLTMTLAGTAFERIVTGHDETITESDDAVRFVSQNFKPVTLELAARRDMTAAFYGLASCHDGSAASDCLRLAIENPESGNIDDTIALASAEQAATLRAWLVAHAASGRVPDTIGSRRFALAYANANGGAESGVTLTARLAAGLRVIRVAGNAAEPGATSR